MKKPTSKFSSFLTLPVLLMLLVLLLGNRSATAQTDASDTTDKKAVTHGGAVKNTFESNLILDDQTVMVPSKGTLEWDIQHRFGIVNNGYSNLYGFFAPPVVRLGFEYVPLKSIQFGFGLCSDRMQLDLNAKLALVKQKDGGTPVSVTYYGNMAIDTRSKSNFIKGGDRISYFDQLMAARKFCPEFSAQAAISIAHFNNVPGYYDARGEIQNAVRNDQFTLSFMGRYKLSNQLAILVDYDQPLTQNYTSNPHPNIAFGLEVATSSHCFQIILGNAQYILPQNIALYNQNDLSKGQYLLGFNMTKLWSF